MAQWLLDRLYEHKDQPSARFAFQGSINWIRALAKVIEDENDFLQKLDNAYNNIQRRKVNEQADTSVFEFILQSLHHLAALEQMKNIDNAATDLSRVAIVSWYYSLYFASKAMNASASGDVQENHSKTAKVWGDDIVKANLAVYPFDLSLISLVEKNSDSELEKLRDGNIYDLNTYAKNSVEAHGALISYLKGTRKYKAWEIEEQIKDSKEFKNLGFTDFRKKRAREMRDARLAKDGVNFMIQAFRYRGKANYRDSIFLSYGDDNSEKLIKFNQDLHLVAERFLMMSIAFCKRRVEKGTWEKFVDDIRLNSRINLSKVL